MKRKLSENFKRVQQRIQDACARADRSPSSVTLVAVTKSVSLDTIRTLVGTGVVDLGENRVQELTRRAAMIREWLDRRARDPAASAHPRPRWHMIGHLQRNKVKSVLPWTELIHSVDSLRLADHWHRLLRDRFLVVDGGDVLSDPLAALGRLLAFAGLESSPGLVDAMHEPHGARLHRAATQPDHWKHYQPMMKSGQSESASA